MAHTEYTYSLAKGWTQPRTSPLFPPVTDETLLWKVLVASGYQVLAHSGPGRCGVGHFDVWALGEPRDGFPRYLIEIDQMGDHSLVKIASLPDLWEFLRLYGAIGFEMQRCLPGDHDDEDDDEDEDEDENNSPFPPTPQGFLAHQMSLELARRSS